MKKSDIKETIKTIKKMEECRLKMARKGDLRSGQPSFETAAILGQLGKPLIDRDIMAIDYDDQRSMNDIMSRCQTNKRTAIQKKESQLP